MYCLEPLCSSRHLPHCIENSRLRDPSLLQLGGGYAGRITAGLLPDLADSWSVGFPDMCLAAFMDESTRPVTAAGSDGRRNAI